MAGFAQNIFLDLFRSGDRREMWPTTFSTLLFGDAEEVRDMAQAVHDTAPLWPSEFVNGMGQYQAKMEAYWARSGDYTDEELAEMERQEREWVFDIAQQAYVHYPYPYMMPTRNGMMPEPELEPM